MGAYESGFTVTITSGPNGSVSPSGTVFLARGQSLAVTVTPDADCYVSDVLVDGQSTGPSASPILSYTFADEPNCRTLAATFLARPAITYVSTNSANVYPYDTWEKAAAVIQNAVDALRSTGGKVWASNGVYAEGGATVHGMRNRVALTRLVTLRSVNGPDVTFICGQGPLGADAVRCAYVTNGAALIGFTLTNGFTRSSVGDFELSGGGAWLDRGGTISGCAISGNSSIDSGGGLFCNYGGAILNCVVSGNASREGGGIYCDYGGIVQDCTVRGNLSYYSGGGIECNCGGTVLNCTISGNTSSHFGGGVELFYGGMLRNCWVDGNTSDMGGGICCSQGSTVLNGTISGNTASQGGGIYHYGGVVINSIVFANTGGFFYTNVYTEGQYSSFTNCCSPPTHFGPSTIESDPLFVNAAAGDYRLQTNSPCINAGTNQTGMAGATDLDGRPRVIQGIVDIGAYEALLPGWDEDADGLPDEWEWDRARTLTGLAPDADADGDGADNLAEYGADTDPFSASSLLLLTSIIPEAGGMRVAWRGGQNAWQYLERSTNLSAGAEGWTAVYTNTPPTALSAEALDAAPAGEKAFYRVRAQR